MGELILIGMGLWDELDISIRGLDELKTADAAFIELYTSLMGKLSINKLAKLAGKTISVVDRHALEEENGRIILEKAKKTKTVLLVPGDPLIATTHVALRIQAEKEGIKTRVIHGASIMSAVMGLSGLHNYKFGKSVTIPFPQKDFISKTPYEVIKENKKLGLHTFCFLDINAEEKRYMRINEALEILLKLEEKEKANIITNKTLIVGVARAGSRKPAVKAGFLEDLLNYDFGKPPHTLIIPSELHFMEAEALIELARGPTAIRRFVK
ncbi:MAG: diphthine synthase [Candidatus Bathyarchaeota archaeon]|nr:diphthine synthase [Candidatus Bathyarchaeota archaeon]